MIHELKKNVFRSILIGASGVLFAILFAWNCVNAVRTFRQADAVLTDAEQLFLSERGKKDQRPRGGRESDRFELLQSVSSGDLAILELNENGKITGATDPDTAGDFTDIVSCALEKEAEYGTKDGWRYYLTKQPGRSYLILLNVIPLRAEVLETAGWSLLAFLAASALFALGAAILTKHIVTPVEQAVTAQKRFIADASHELKTPLTVIDANATVLEKSIGQNKWLDYIKEQTSRMTSLVTALLTLSRLEEERVADVAVAASLFDAAEILMESVLPFESAAFERGLSLQTDAPDTLSVTGHADDFRQIIGILLDNALKHARPDSGILLSLRRNALKQNRSMTSAIVLTVSNTGETIPPDALPHLFDRFYRVDSSRTHTENSFGLGLSIARALTEKNKGTISVSSENGLTVFTVCLPVIFQEAAASQPSDMSH